MTASNHIDRRPTDPAERTLDVELGLVREAVAMVAKGGAPRVILGGLRFGEQVLEPARRMAAGRGVRIVPLWTTDEAGLDLAVERDPDA